MLRSEPMSKLVLCGLNRDLPQVSHILSQQQLVHMIDYDGEADGFTSGGSLEYGATVSGNLVRVRSLLKILVDVVVQMKKVDGKFRMTEIYYDPAGRHAA